ncbi:MAG: NADP-dependent oxidoreductase [Methylobacteriaceae bacterium]|nr:NADP-dependent oxidoreductase [Methylobacteriaceae bacterium]
MALVNRKFVLASRPQGPAGPENFRLIEEPVPSPGEGEVLVRNRFLSLDPYMRGRMNAEKSYAPPQPVGEVMIGGTLGEVIAARRDGFEVGDLVVGMGGWQEYSLSDGKALRKIPQPGIAIEAWLGPVGMPGVTAWYGITRIIAPKPGETVVVSAATGAVGTVAGQLAKLAGARVIGVAGGPAKCRYAVEELGYDACIDHRAADFGARLAEVADKGIDGVFENVGGEPLNRCMALINTFARIAICGLVASGYDGSPTPLANVGPMLIARATMQGFIVSDHMDLWPQALDELAHHVAAGRIRWRETIAEGLEAAPGAFFDMLKGRNFGKQLVKLV